MQPLSRSLKTIHGLTNRGFGTFGSAWINEGRWRKYGYNVYCSARLAEHHRNSAWAGCALPSVKFIIPRYLCRFGYLHPTNGFPSSGNHESRQFFTAFCIQN